MTETVGSWCRVSSEIAWRLPENWLWIGGSSSWTSQPRHSTLATSRELAELLVEIADDALTIIAVTHDTKFARELTIRVVLLANGRALADAAPVQFFNAPTLPETKEFV